MCGVQAEFGKRGTAPRGRLCRCLGRISVTFRQATGGNRLQIGWVSGLPCPRVQVFSFASSLHFASLRLSVERCSDSGSAALAGLLLDPEPSKVAVFACQVTRLTGPTCAYCGNLTTLCCHEQAQNRKNCPRTHVWSEMVKVF